MGRSVSSTLSPGETQVVWSGESTFAAGGEGGVRGDWSIDKPFAPSPFPLPPQTGGRG